MSLPDFLRARVADDEAVVRGRWRRRWSPRSLVRRRLELDRFRGRRRIVAQHTPVAGECVVCVEAFPCFTLRAVARHYASHGDYRPEWRL